MKEDKENASRVNDDPGEMSEREIDVNLEQSFPASDPPSWTLGSDHRSDPNEEDEENAEEAK